MKGSLTVEAAWIFPFSFIVIGSICFLGVFLYDQVVLKITGYECVLQTMEQEELGEAAFSDALKKKAESMAGNRMLTIVDLQADVKISASKITLTYHGKQKLWNLPVNTTIVYQNTFPELTLRLIRKN